MVLIQSMVNQRSGVYRVTLNDVDTLHSKSSGLVTGKLFGR